MNNLTPTTLLPQADIDLVFALIAIVKDPVAAESHLQKIATASAELHESLKELAQGRADLEAARLVRLAERLRVDRVVGALAARQLARHARLEQRF